MSYLLTSDLHGNPDWFRHILHASHGKQATLIPGDLLDWHDETRTEYQKISVVLNFANAMEARGNSLIFTSGNHDLDEFEIFGDSSDCDLDLCIDDSNWMNFPDLNGLQAVSGYGGYREFEDMVVASIQWIPWDRFGELIEKRVSDLCANASRVAEVKGKKLAFLYHEKPESSFFIEDLVNDYRPDYFFCGHEHEPPFSHGPARLLGETIIINLGQRLDEPLPSHAVLNATDNTLSWYTHVNGFDGQAYDLNELTLKRKYEIAQSNPNI